MPETKFEPELPSVVLDNDASADRTRPTLGRASVSRAWWVATIAVVVALAAGIYWWWLNRPAPAPLAPPPVAEAPPAPKAEPTIRHPIDDARANVAAPAEDRPAGLGESDTVMRTALSGVPGAAGFERLFYPEEIVRRFVATVDNLTRRSVSAKVMVAKPVPGLFAATTVDGRLAVSPDNAARYTPYLRLAETVDSKKLLALYVRFYPWFQQAYQDLGYPSGYFNDRLIDVIDNLLATPDVPTPVALVQPHVLYEFARPDLEALSAGQKIMIRMGPDNAARARTKLRELRHLLTGAVAPP